MSRFVPGGHCKPMATRRTNLSKRGNPENLTHRNPLETKDTLPHQVSCKLLLCYDFCEDEDPA